MCDTATTAIDKLITNQVIRSPCAAKGLTGKLFSWYFGSNIGVVANETWTRHLYQLKVGCSSRM